MGESVEALRASGGSFYISSRSLAIFVCDFRSSGVSYLLYSLVAFRAFATAVLADGFVRIYAFARAALECSRRVFTLTFSLRASRGIVVYRIRAACTREGATYEACVYLVRASARAMFYGRRGVLYVIYSLGFSRLVVLARCSYHGSYLSSVYVILGQDLLRGAFLHYRRRVLAFFVLAGQGGHDGLLFQRRLR